LILSNTLRNTFTNSRMISINFYVHSAKPTSVNLSIAFIYFTTQQIRHNIARLRSYILSIKIILYNITI